MCPPKGAAAQAKPEEKKEAAAKPAAKAEEKKGAPAAAAPEKKTAAKPAAAPEKKAAAGAPKATPVPAFAQGEPVYSNDVNGDWECGRTWNDYRYKPLCHNRAPTPVYAPPPKEEKKGEEKKGGDAKKPDAKPADAKPAEEEKKAEAFAQLTPE